ncbi:hypothetical protein WBG78_20325 [Chryseolinea sp. T2]|uniref:hypothetical protein n=1 Tax=Chryseolinea sp. T2 TaxID=3129255 RepID=UPI0030780817
MRITILLLILFFASCSKESDDLTIGELYFSSLRIGNLYGAADSTIRNAELYLDTARLETADSSDSEAIRLFRRFRDEGFMYKPFVDLRRSDSTYVKLYLDSADYDKIKVYKWKYLLDNKKKVIIRGRTKSLGKLAGDELYYCTEFIEAKLVDGATFPKSEGKIWQVEDYN